MHLQFCFFELDLLHVALQVLLQLPAAPILHLFSLFFELLDQLPGLLLLPSLLKLDMLAIGPLLGYRHGFVLVDQFHGHSFTLLLSFINLDELIKALALIILLEAVLNAVSINHAGRILFEVIFHIRLCFNYFLCQSSAAMSSRPRLKVFFG